MSSVTMQDRLAAKTPEAAFMHVMQDEFNFSQRVSRELLSVAQELLVGDGPAMAVRPGQVRLVVAQATAPFGPPLTATAKVEVTLTVDAGAEDAAVQARDGRVGLRQGRTQSVRVTAEAWEQEGVLTQEDLARVLGVDRRTIVRDVRVLQAAGHLVPTRGAVKGVGRGQSHKVRIIELWLDRAGYEQIARRVHHSHQAIKRYISTFLRMIVLQRRGLAVEEIAFLTRASVRLVRDYLALYEPALTKSHWQEKLAEELARVSSAPPVAAEKGGTR